MVYFVFSLTNLEDQWKKWIEEHLSHEQTITNCLITAAYVSYCGPFDKDIRRKIYEFVATCCQKHEIPKEPQQIFKVLLFCFKIIVCFKNLTHKRFLFV
jgi:hypothetical protein